MREDNIRFTWGMKDGSGDLYITTLPDYLDNWLQADTYSNYPPSIGVNISLQDGNSINNIADIYPNADYVEFYNACINPKYAGMDWRALRLVFEHYQGEYYLVAIVSAQWTI